MILRQLLCVYREMDGVLDGQIHLIVSDGEFNSPRRENNKLEDQKEICYIWGKKQQRTRGPPLIFTWSNGQFSLLCSVQSIYNPFNLF